jgi:hypothetical protein
VSPAGRAAAPAPSPAIAGPAAVAYVPFEVSDFVETSAGHWQASAAPLPSDSVERIEISITLKPGVRLRNVGRSCAHAAVDVTTSKEE